MSSFEPDAAQPLQGFVAEPLAGSAAPFSQESAPAAGVAPPEDPERVRQRAFEEGREAGRAELPWREAEGLRAATGALEQAVRALTALRRDYLRSHRRAVVDLAVAVAERILVREVAGVPDALAAMVSRALESIEEGEPLRVHLSPRDAETLAAADPAPLTGLRNEGLEIVSDDELCDGDVRLRADVTEVDARLGALLARVREDLLRAVDAEEGTA